MTRVSSRALLTLAVAGAVAVPSAQQVRFDDVVRNLRNPDPKQRAAAVRLLRDAKYPEAVAPMAPLVLDPLDDIAKLLAAFRKLLQAGHSLLVIEHNLDVIKTADWIVDLGPEGGEEGGQIVAVGTPEQVAKIPESHTGRYLRDVLATGRSNAYAN